MFDFIGPAISAAGNLLSGALSSRSAGRQADENIEMQKEFAQHGIRWKVEDAKAAGLHPLYALQGSGATFNPNPIVASDYGIGSALHGMGQDVSRAAQASVSKPERDDLQRKLLEAQIATQQAQAGLIDAQRRKLDNENVGSSAITYALTPDSHKPMVVRELPSQAPAVGRGDGLDELRFQPRAQPNAGRVSYKDSEVTSPSRYDSTRVAGVHAPFKMVKIGDEPGRLPAYIHVPENDTTATEFAAMAKDVREQGLFTYLTNLMFGGVPIPKYRRYPFHDPVGGAYLGYEPRRFRR